MALRAALLLHFFYPPLLGVIIGSFLNCVIYRLPRSLSLLTPSRSFCPSCKRSLSWWENLPLLSWIFLRKRCAGCQQPISGRYFLVELLTALLFWGCSFYWEFPEIVACWLFLALAITATFIDLEWMIIPDLLTWGGTVSGILFSFLFPALMETNSRKEAFFFSTGGAAFGYLLLWGILEVGKIAFGHHKVRWDHPTSLQLIKKEKKFLLLIEEEEIFLEDLLVRNSDKITFKAEKMILADQEFSSVSCTITQSGLHLSFQRDQPQNLNCLEREPKIHAMTPTTWNYRTDPFLAEVTELILPREAMGFGDVKFLACIGAFLGLKGVLFSLFVGSFIGAIAGGAMLLFTRGRIGRCIPFGPYLAAGAVIWLFYHPSLKMFLWP